MKENSNVDDTNVGDKDILRERDYYKLRFEELDKQWNRAVEELLGKDYYNYGCDWASCDKLTVDDLIYKYKKKRKMVEIFRKNSIEEDIRILEKNVESVKENSDMAFFETDEDYYFFKAVDHILSDYKRLLKENQELKEKNR